MADMKFTEITKEVKNDLRGKIAKQTSTLFASQIIALFMGVFIGIVNTRTLGPEGYGVLAFFLTITSLTVLFFRFGLFSAAGLLIAEEKDKEKERELIGASVLLALCIGISFTFFILALSFFVDDIFNTEIGGILRGVSVLLIALPFSLLVPDIGRGANKIGFISLFNIIPNALYLIGAVILLNLIQIEPVHFITLNVVSMVIAVITVIYLFKPKFHNLKYNMRKIRKRTKDYGLHIYLGTIANQSTYKLDKIFITYFVGLAELGFYSLAMIMTVPMAGLSQALSSSLFKGFVDRDRIPKKIMQYNLLWLLFCVVFLFIFGRFIVVLLFSEVFLPVVPLILPLSIAAFFQGLYQPYAFLAAKGKGKWIKNVAYAEAISNIVGTLILIILFGVIGAAIGSAISKFIHWSMLRSYYKKYLRSQKRLSGGHGNAGKK